MTTFYANGIKHTNHTNKATGFPKLVVNSSYFLAFTDKGYKSKYEFGEWMYFEGPIVLTKDNKRYRVAASGIGGFSTAKFNAYFSLKSEVSSVDYVPTVGSYYPGSKIFSNYSTSGGTIYLSGARSGTYLCLAAGRVYSHWNPPTWGGYSGYSGYGWRSWHGGSDGYWSVDVRPSTFKRVE